MDTKAIDILAAEADAAAIPVASVIEGLEDYLSLNLHPDSKVEVSALLAEYQRRRDLLAALGRGLATVRKVIEALLADGHPDMVTREVGGEVVADLAENLLTLTDARGQFSERALTTEGVLEIGPETPAA